MSLSKQAKQERILDEVTPFNASKKKEEALVLLKKWFLKMENFNGQLKKYQVTITDLLEENRWMKACSSRILSSRRFFWSFIRACMILLDSYQKS